MEALSLFDVDLRPATPSVSRPGSPESPLHAAPRRPDDAPARRQTTRPLILPSGPVLLAVDGNSLAHRAFHAYASRPDGGAYGFLALLAGLCDRVDPAGLVVGFDCPDHSERRARHPAYKAHRGTKDPQLVGLIAGLPALLDELGIETCSARGWEADDVVASAARAAADEGWRCVIATSDRDAFALVTDRTTVLRLRSGLDAAVEVTPARLRRDLGIEPDQYVEFAALRGDVSDNLPGVAGIGPARARELLRAFPSVDAAAADPIGLVSVLGRRAGRALVDDLAGPASVFRRNVALMTAMRDLDVQPARTGRRIRPETLTDVLARRGLGALAARLALAVALRPDRLAPAG